MWGAAQIEIVAALGQAPGLSPEQVARTSCHPQVLSRLSRFSGRPVTEIYACADRVIKTRSELEFADAAAARDWIAARCEHERLLGCYHPEKTWLVLHGDDSVKVASVTPRLVALDDALQQAGADVAEGLAQVASLCLAVAARSDVALDEGLSNFAFTASGQLVYLDDDHYPLQQHSSLCATLVTWIRRFTALPAADWEQVGGRMRTQLLASYGDEGLAQTLASQLYDHFVAGAAQESHRAALAAGLCRSERDCRGRSAVGACLEAGSFPRRSLVMADIYGNLPALEAILRQADADDIDDILVLGDVVGYGPAPGACIDLLRTRGCHVLQGNLDWLASSDQCLDGISDAARWSVEWTRQQLSPAQRDWLAGLPRTLDGDSWLGVHGALVEPRPLFGYIYDATAEDNLAAVVKRGKKWLLHGQSHRQGVFYLRRGLDGFVAADHVALAPFEAGLICPGSVGRSRYGRDGCEYLVIDWQQMRVRGHRLPYDASTVVMDMAGHGFPALLSNGFLARN